MGQQAVVLVATPGKPHNIYKVFGAKPLEDVMKNLKSLVMDELETALAQQAPPRVQVKIASLLYNSSIAHELFSLTGGSIFIRIATFNYRWHTYASRKNDSSSTTCIHSTYVKIFDW